MPASEMETHTRRAHVRHSNLYSPLANAVRIASRAGASGSVLRPVRRPVGAGKGPGRRMIRKVQANPYTSTWGVTVVVVVVVARVFGL